jgi:uncharacterized protein with GYD domain
MATYIVLMNWTEQGIKSFQDSPSRSDVGREEMEKHGVQRREIYWTVGPHDLVMIVEAPDDETLAAALLGVGSAGNVRTTTMRAFTRSEFTQVIDRAG